MTGAGTLDQAQAALVEERLGAVRARLEAALQRDSGDEDSASLGIADALEVEVEARLRAASRDGAGLPIAWLRDRLELTATEERLLWLLIAHELCPVARGLIRQLATEQVSDVTLDALRRVVYGARAGLRAWRELAPSGALQRLGLIERIGDLGDVPAHRMTFRVARRVLALVHGDVALDDELAGLAAPAAAPLAIDELELEAGAAARARACFARPPGLAIAHGVTGAGRRSLWLAAAREAGHQLLAIDARRLSPERAELARQLRLLARECRLLRRTPLLLHLDALAGAGGAADRLDVVEAELAGLVLATAARPIARRWQRPPATIELPPLTGARRAKLWRRALPGASAADAELLATLYPLAPALIREVGGVAAAEAGAAAMRPCHVEAGVRAVLDDRLAGLARRISVSQTWDDLVLPDDQTTAIVELLARIRARRRVYEDWGFADKLGKGLGVAALFSGPPGTGKTMCAGLIARDLGTELYQVDPSRIVSKWIGETEQHLAALFDAAEAGHAILLFDEADALFGRRTEVRTSNDRHANQEVGYLLQRLESFSGICILTTNHEASIDEAFRRRFSIHVRFPVPDVEERAKLWRALLPRRAPVAGALGLEDLARKYVMSGGYIRNAVLRAAFLAADEDAAIGAEHLAYAAQLEYEAMGKLA